MSYSILEKVTYNLYINSTDKVSGTNNNANYMINWNDFLPDKYFTYKMIWNMQTIGGYYKDSNTVAYSMNGAQTGTTISGTISNVFIGMQVSGLGVAANTVVTNVAGNVVTISNPLVLQLTNTSVTFTGSIYSTAKIVVNFGGRSYSFDTATKAESYVIGFITRDPQGTTTSSNTLSAFYGQNCPKTMNRPNQNLVNIQIYNGQNPTQLFVNTDTNGNAQADMTNYNLTIEFMPIAKTDVDERYLN
jgi:hypothetical protein